MVCIMVQKSEMKIIDGKICLKKNHSKQAVILLNGNVVPETIDSEQYQAFFVDKSHEILIYAKTEKELT